MLKPKIVRSLFIILFLLFAEAGKIYAQSSSAIPTLAVISLNKAGFCFGKTDTLNTIPYEPTKIYCDDFDYDGNNDLVFNKYFLSPNSGAILFFKGSPSGTFAPVASAIYTVPSASGIKDFCVGDFNSDGKKDFATIDELGKIWVFKNLSAGSLNILPASGSFTIGGNTFHPTIEALNLDGNGYADLVVGQPNATLGIAITPIVNTSTSTTGPITFLPLVPFNAFASNLISSKPFVTIGSFNTDALPDICVADRNIGNKLEVYYNTGSGNYYNIANNFAFSFSGIPQSVKVKKLDANSTDDIAILVRNGSSNTLNFLLSTGSNSFTPGIPYTVSASIGTAIDFEITDYNKDTFLDLSIADTASNFVRIVRGNTNIPPFFSNISDAINLSNIGTGKFRLATGDADKNTFDDIIVYGSHPFSNFPTITILNHSYSPTITVTGNPICKNGKAVLTATIPNGSNYSWVPSGGTAAGNQYTVTTPNSYYTTASFSVFPGSVGSCTALSKPITVNSTTLNLKTFPIPGLTVCQGSNFSIEATGGNVYFLANTSQTIFAGSPTQTVVFPALPTGTPGLNIFALAATDGNCIDTNFIFLNVLKTPTISGVSVVPPVICDGQASVITVTPSIPLCNCSYTWTGTNITATSGNGAISSLTVEPWATSMYYVAFKGNSDNCIGIDSVEVTVYPSIWLTSTVTPAQLCIGKQATITVSGADNYLWSSGKSTSSVVITPTSNPYQDTVVGTGTSGCRSKIIFDIEVNNVCPDIIPYNIITPNGDGLNDWFIIDNIELYPNNIVKIYNRWGQELSEIPKYHNTFNYWSGTVFDGNKNDDEINKNLPSGTYFYIIELGDNSPIRKGFVELIRR